MEIYHTKPNNVANESRFFQNIDVGTAVLAAVTKYKAIWRYVNNEAPSPKNYEDFPDGKAIFTWILAEHTGGILGRFTGTAEDLPIAYKEVMTKFCLEGE